MNIWHVCSISSDHSNGMNNIIPCYAREQAKSEKVIILNLNEYKIICDDVQMFNLQDLKDIKFKGLIAKAGVPDLVVFHGIYIFVILEFYYRYVKDRYRYIVVPHGSMTEMAQRKSRWKKMIFNHMLVYGFTRKASAVHFLSDNEKASSDHKFYKSSFVVPNGVYRQKKHYEAKNRDDINLTYIGRIDSYHKGLDILIQACENLYTFMKQNEIKIYIYGLRKYRKDEEFIENVEKAKLDNCIFIYEGVFDQTKEDVLLQADYFIQTSRLEGMPMGILEALSYGIPLLVTEGTCMADLVRKYNCGVAVTTTVEGVEKLIQAAVDKRDNLQDMSQASLQCAENFYWDIVVEKMLKKYRSVINAD